MSIVVQMKGGKDHLAKWELSLGQSKLVTVCGKEVSDGSRIIESAPRVDLCKNCYEWLGRQTVGDWLGIEYFTTPMKTSIYTQNMKVSG